MGFSFAMASYFIEPRSNSSASSISQIDDFESYFSDFLVERSGTSLSGTETEGFESKYIFSAAEVDFDDLVSPDVLVDRQSDSSYAVAICDSLTATPPSELSLSVKQVVDSLIAEADSLSLFSGALAEQSSTSFSGIGVDSLNFEPVNDCVSADFSPELASRMSSSAAGMEDVDSFLAELGLPCRAEQLPSLSNSSSSTFKTEYSLSLLSGALAEQSSTSFSGTGVDSSIVEPVNDRVSADLLLELASRMSSSAAEIEDSFICNMLSPSSVESTSNPPPATDLSDSELIVEEVILKSPPIELTVSATEGQLQQPPPTTSAVECAKVDRVHVETSKLPGVKRCAVPKSTVIEKVKAAPAPKNEVECSVSVDGFYTYTITPWEPQPLPKTESAKKRLESPYSCEPSTEPPAKKRATDENKLPEMRNKASASYEPPAKKQAAKTPNKKLTPIQKACQTFLRNTLRSKERRGGPR